MKTWIYAGLWLAMTASAANITDIDPANFDPQTPACEDFYQHANGGWARSNPVPDAYSGWGVSNEVRSRNYRILRQILEQAANRPDAGDHNTQLLGRFYATGMNSEQLEAQGLQPLQATLSRVTQIGSVDELTDFITEMNARGMALLFNTEVYPDLKDSSRYRLYVYQGELGLPDRDFYLKDDLDSRRIRHEYQRHVARTLVLAGLPRKQALKQAKAIMQLETRLARAAMSRVDLREPENTYRLVGVREADKHTPNFLWTRYLGELGLDGVETFSFSQPDYFAELDQALADVPLATWKAWLRWSLLSDASPYLAEKYEREHFAFYGKVLEGSRRPKARWKRVLGEVNEWLGEALGQAYVEQAFSPQARARVLDMVQDLQTALKQRLATMPWMTESTRRQALAKLASFRAKIGYPERWRDYSGLRLPNSSYLANVSAAQQYDFQQNLAKLGQPVDPLEWDMNPQEVNAYYDPTGNEVVFPAGILQPPYYDPGMDDAYNYGSMGAIIGHELMHGFDDEGSRYDAQGNLRDWWRPIDRQRFEQRAEKLVRQFDAFTVPGGLHVNGRLTLGENIADLGGLLVAWDALQLRLQQKPQPTVNGLTPAQRFFYAYAQSWRRNYRPEALKLMVKTNVHAPAHFRVNGPLANLKSFQQAFACKPGQAMVNEEPRRVEIW